MSMLVAYLDSGDIVATLEAVVMYDTDGTPLGLCDFDAHEEAGGEATAIWIYEQPHDAPPVKGSKVWPEYLNQRVYDFRVELVGPPGNKRIAALVHKVSGYRRDRATIDAAIAARIAAADEHAPVDLSDIVGTKYRPLILDDEGRTVTPGPPAPRPDLPIVRVNSATPGR